MMTVKITATLIDGEKVTWTFSDREEGYRFWKNVTWNIRPDFIETQEDWGNPCVRHAISMHAIVRMDYVVSDESNEGATANEVVQVHV